jgi:hypothetical protein
MHRILVKFLQQIEGAILKYRLQLISLFEVARE